MPVSTPAKSMFFRRLAMILALVVLMMAVLSGQLWRLTVVQGASLYEAAESKLITKDWLPTFRGQIIDRKGRILARDRPAFDIAVDFRVISGEWAVREAAKLARSEAGTAGWARLDPQEKQARIDEFVPVFQQHLEHMWASLGAIAGVSEGQLLEKRTEVERRVAAMSRWLSSQRIGQELRARLAKGEEITAELEEDLLKRHGKPITEQKAPHVILSSVPDPVGFELRRLADVKMDLNLLLASGDVATVSVPVMPGLSVVDAGDREYPFERVEVEVDTTTLPGPLRGEGKLKVVCEGVAYHVLGRMKDTAQAEDSQRRRKELEADSALRERAQVRRPGLPKPIDRGEYLDNDPAGQAGIEASQEAVLRGLRGVKFQRLDTGFEETVDATPGRDVQLTLDIMLQARVQAAMSRELGLAVAQPWQHADHPENITVPDGTLLNGAAVVLDIESGDILAMVSTPTIPRRLLRESPEAVFKNPLNEKVDVPWLNRAIALPYPPGSIVKALILNAAVKLGRFDLDSTIECAGHLLPNKPEQYRCWIFKQFKRTHGPLHAPDALMVSCNIFFFTLGQRLGPEGIAQAYRMFGLGEAWDLGVGTESSGFIGSFIRNQDGSLARDEYGKVRTAPPSPSDAIQMGIGQGPVAWTPLHAADAYATLARGGIRMTPRLIAGSPRQTTDLQLDTRAVREALAGLSKSVNEHDGTGHHIRFENGADVPHFNAEGVQVWGKTGTAQAPTIPVKAGDPLYDRAFDDLDLPPGVRALRRGDHSWFVVLAGKAGENKPRYAIAVMMEYAGSGGKVSGPIINQVVHALKAEGYL